MLPAAIRTPNMPSIASAPERLPATLIELTIWSRRMPNLFVVFFG